MSMVNFNFFKKLNPKEKIKKGVPLVVTYHPSLNFFQVACVVDIKLCFMDLFCYNLIVLIK